MSRLLTILLAIFSLQLAQAQCPNVTVISSDSVYCHSDSVILIANGIPVASTVEWNVGAGYVAGSARYAYVASTYQFQDLDLRVTLSNGTICNYSFQDLCFVRAPLALDFDVSRTDLCFGPDTIQLTDKTPGSAQRSWVLNTQTFNNTPVSTIASVSNLGNVDITLIADDSLGCRTVGYYYDTLRVFDDLALDFDFTNTAHCVPYSTSFNSYFTNGNIQSVNWTFQGADNPSSTSTFVSAVNYRNAGLFDVTLQVTKTNGCVYTLTKEDYIELGEEYVLDLTYTDTVVCLSEKVIVDQNTSVQGRVNWDVAPGELIRRTRNLAEISYRDTGYHDLYYSIDHNGCVSRDSLMSFIFARGSKADFSSINNMHCDTPHQVDLVNLSDTTSAGISGFIWNVYNSETDSLMFSSTLKDPSFTIDSLPALYDVELIATDLQGCSDTLRESEFIDIGPYEVDIRPFSDMVCSGARARFRNFTQNVSPQGTESYQWYFYKTSTGVLVDSSTDRSATLAFSDTGYYSFQLITLNDQGCSDTSYVDSSVLVANIQASMVLSDTAICFNDSIQVEGFGSPAFDEYTYRWDLLDSNGNLIDSSEVDSFYQPLLDPGVYTLRYILDIQRLFGNDVCADTLDQYVYANGVRGSVEIDTNSGCAPITIHPSFIQQYNYHFGDSSEELQYNWTITPTTNVVSTGITDSTPTFTLNNEARYRISVFVSNSKGCSYFDLQGSDIRVGVLARFQPRQDTLCVNNTLELTNRSQGFPTDLDWVVTPNQNYILDSLDFDHYNITFDAPGLYEVELQANKDNLCADTFSRRYEVLAFETDVTIVDSVLYCAPQLAQFRNNSTLVDSIRWYFGDGDSAYGDTSALNHIYNTNDTFDVTLIGTNRFGCIDTTVKQNFVTVVGPRIQLSYNNSSGCEGLEVSFFDSSIGTDLSYMDYGDGSTFDSSVTGFNHTYFVSNGDSMQYFSPTLHVENALGCAAYLTLDSAILVYAQPEPLINLLTDTAVCEGSPVIFEAQGLYSDSVAWFADGVFLGNANTDSFIFNSLGYHYLKLIAFNDHGCVDSVEQDVFVKEIPSIMFDTSFLSCYDQTFTRTATLSSSGLSANYAWDMDEVGNPDNIQIGPSNTASINYQISGPKNILLTVSFSNGCISVDSTTAFVIGPDSIPPAVINYVTVNTAGSLNVNHQSSTYEFFNSFELFKNNTLINTTTNNNSTVFNDPSVVNAPNSYCYSLRIIDICGNNGLSSVEHCAVVLSATSTRHKEVDLIWTPYIGWDSVNAYEIYRSYGSEPMTLIVTVDGNITQYTDTSLCEDLYTYYVKAIQAAGPYSSNSNRVDINSLYIYNTRNPSVIRVTVNDLEEIDLNWEASDYEDPMNYRIRKYISYPGTEIEEFNTTNTFLNDVNVNTSATSYYYTVNEVDQCDNETTEGRYGKSILLESEFSNNAVQLSWSAYEDWLNGVDRYDVLIREFGVYKIVNTVNGNTLNYADGAVHQENINGEYEYKVRAIGVDNDTSYSNITFVRGEPVVYIPNAFSPNADGHNEGFKPIMRFTVSSTSDRPDDYHFEVYNRWGQLLFDTYDRDAYWDGSYMNSVVQQGVYFYKLKVSDKNGKSYRYKGTVTVLR